ncbi:hypothetical protein SAMN05216267_106831, partial [Actinacidiphila rubida]
DDRRDEDCGRQDRRDHDEWSRHDRRDHDDRGGSYRHYER